MHGPLPWFASPGSASDLLEQRRAQAIVQRVRSIARLFAGLTLAWIAIDVAVFPPPIWKALAGARIAAGAALLLLAYACRMPAPSRGAARVRLALIFAIPAAFFLATLVILRNVPPEGISQGVAAAYSFVPFMLAAGLAAFPLAPRESFALALFALVIQAAAITKVPAPPMPFAEVDALWLLLLIAAVGAFAAASQLRLMAALVHQAIRDPLTGCLRHESGHELLELQYHQAVRREAPLAVLFADLDRFKSVNDRFGHEVGDEVLAAAAAGLASVLRASDILVRWGGEEFVVALPDTPKAEAVKLIERLRTRGMGRVPDGAAVTLSIGIAEYREDAAPTVDALVELADQRMYAAKQAGRNRYVNSTDAPAVTILS